MKHSASPAVFEGHPRVLWMSGYTALQGEEGAEWTGLWACSPHFTQTAQPSLCSWIRFLGKASARISSHVSKILTITVPQLDKECVMKFAPPGPGHKIASSSLLYMSLETGVTAELLAVQNRHIR